MPIRINLLAEEQAAEEMRKRDPVKRAILLSAAVGVIFVLFSAVMVVRGMGAKRTLKAREADWEALEPKELAIKADKAEIAEIERKLTALNQLAAYRFLWGLPLDAFQKCITSVEGVNLVQIKVDQVYTVTEPKPLPKPGSRDYKEKAAGPKPPPANSKEKIVIVIEARDYGNPVDQNYDKFKQALINFPYFKEHLKPNGVLLKDLSQPQQEPGGDPTKTFLRFVLECQFPEVTRP
jgi:hypothetical protein